MRYDDGKLIKEIELEKKNNLTDKERRITKKTKANKEGQLLILDSGNMGWFWD